MESARSEKGILTKSVLRSTDISGDIEISHPEEEDTASDFSQSFYNVDSDLAQSVFSVALQDFCGPCKLQEEGEPRTPEWYCTECDELLCKQCTSHHKVLKATRNHTLLTYDEKMKTMKKMPCHPCKDSEDGRKIVPSTWYCRECDDFLCDSCRSHHRSLKLTRGHTLITSEERYSEESKKKETSLANATRSPNVTVVAKSSDKLSIQGGNKKKEVTVPVPKPYVERNAESLGRYNARIPEDQITPEIYGSSFISESRLLVSDCRNDCLKLFHLKNSGLHFITKKTFDSYIRGVCVYDASEVSVGVEGDIIRLSVTGSEIKEKKTLTGLGFLCWDIAYMNKDTLAAVGNKPPVFCVLTTDGTILWKLTTDMDGKPLSAHLGFVALNKSKTSAYMTDCFEAVMYTVDIQRREIKSRLKLSEGSGPCGVDVDADDNVYVCSIYHHTIQQISPVGVHVRTLLTKNVLNFPRAISFSPDGNTFIVGSSFLGNGNKLQLFRMK